MSRIYIICSIIFQFLPLSSLANTNNTRWHNEHNDTTTITKILIKASDLHASNPNELVEFIGRQFLGTPYKNGTLEGTPERLTINLDEMDCTTFVETVVALALTVKEEKISWQDFTQFLKSLRYRNGEPNGYSSRLHYTSDWIVTNTHRGYIKEVSDRIPQSDFQIKTLDYMSRHRSAYPDSGSQSVISQEVLVFGDIPLFGDMSLFKAYIISSSLSSMIWSINACIFPEMRRYIDSIISFLIS